MKYSKLFGKTIKDAPSDYQLTSHKLLHKGGFIRQVAKGRYAFLPLGQRVWQKIFDIIDEEMEETGSQRFSTPIFQPIELWKATNRDTAFGSEMHVLDDHHGATFAVGATAEGIVVDTVKKFQLSYKDLPFYMHQFIGKFRDEIRPKGGLLRVREFMMKDAYSFDESEDALNETYEKFYKAYLNIAEKLDLKVKPVLADSGAIGGDYNHEFLVESDAGEAYGVSCDKCDYAAQIEKAEATFKEVKQEKEMGDVKEFWDDTVINCELLAKKMGVAIETTTKTIMFTTEDGFVAAMIRGDYDINETKLRNYLKADTLELASEEDIKLLTGAKVGFVGPVNLPETVKVIADLTCKERINFEAGGNQTGLHLYNLNFERDMKTPEFIDIREVKEGDTCKECEKGKLSIFKGIEWGHCFKLDQFYSKPMDGTYTKDDGSEEHYWMGSYGIGIGRSIATVVETHSDEKGIIWPENIAPFKIHLIGLNLENEKIQKQADDLYQDLLDANIEVLYDDRKDTTAGQKFADSDLIGIPYRAVISKRTEGKIELKKRIEKEGKLVETSKILEI